jgi:two-component system NtrC family sensor kinase
LQAAGLPLERNGTAPVAVGGFWKRFFNLKTVVARPLISDGLRLGTLQVEVNQAPLRTVSLVIWALGTMLAASLAFLATQFRRQEKVISATTIELEEKRRELVRLERLALAGQLSANILHDLKKPVLNIRNEADEAISPLGESSQAEPAPSVFQRIREQADFFLSMLKEAGFDRFVRAGEEREYVDINELLNRSIALVRYEQSSVQVERNFTTDLPPIFADPVRLIQIFSNLVLNAYQAMGGRGRLEVSTSQMTDFVVVEVVDDGPGIPEGVISHIFEPFYTTKPPGQGTGLGLYIVRDILHDMGAEISLESRPGRTAFRLVFPLTA